MTAERTVRDEPSAKDLGRQLRQVRREQGLTRGDVARSAGLTRRELAAYERGRVHIPESDLWCLAGSCGVEVGDLLPHRDDSAAAIEGTGPDAVDHFFAAPRVEDPFLGQPAVASDAAIARAPSDALTPTSHELPEPPELVVPIAWRAPALVPDAAEHLASDDAALVTAGAGHTIGVQVDRQLRPEG